MACPHGVNIGVCADCREASLARAKDRDAALALEDVLWEAVTAEPLVPYAYGMGEASVEELDQLRELSAKAGGWWRFMEFVPLDEWIASVAAEKTGARDG